MPLGDNIRHLRRERGWTQAQLSERAGVKVNQISKLEQNDADPHLSTLYKLMKALECSPDTLLMDEDKVGPDALLKNALERAASLPMPNKLAILEVVEKYCIACRVQQEYSDPEKVGWSRFCEMSEILDPELAEQLDQSQRVAADQTRGKS
jgi:transcriptional regulator with XRE-family HTH domain